MNIRLLGTGAADGIPSFYGNDDVSRYARQHGGKDVRSRSAAIVDGTIKIDLPPDTLMQMRRDGVCACDWTALLFTHSDDDHFAPSELQYSLIPFTELDHLPYTIFANDVVSKRIRQRYPEWPMEIVETRSFECFEHCGYRFIPVKATHITDEDCHNFLIQREGKTLLYATDTGIWSEETFAFLDQFRVDALILECTDGVDPTPYEGHLDISECIMIVGRLRTMGVLKDGSRVVTTHHSVRGLARHCDLEAAFAGHGIEPGFDGMLIEF